VSPIARGGARDYAAARPVVDAIRSILAPPSSK
jgi:hypothetical protein